MNLRWAAVPAVAAAGSLLLATSAGASECVPKPDSPIGYQVRAVGADRIALPARTAPIAILDSGIGSVPELEGRVLPGVNVVTGGQNTNDTDGHGTAVATIAAGRAAGVQGISPTSPLIPIKILDIRGEADAADVVAGIDAAVARGAKVINISATTPGTGTTADDRKVLTAIERAVSKDVVVVAPSGNEGATRLDVPAVYPHVISVGATNESGAVASFSNTGPGLDLAAPGANITTATPAFICSSGYSVVSGTSFSAPAVAGAAALLHEARPGLDATQVGDLLRRPAGASTWSSALGFGILNVPAVLAATPPQPQPTEVDDDVWWVKRRPLALTPSRRRRVVRSRVAPRVDPVDVIKVRLRSGDRFSATLTAGVGLTLGLWDRRTGAFDISAGRTAHRVVAGRRLQRVRISQSGTYYVSVHARAASPAGTAYELMLRR